MCGIAGEVSFSMPPRQTAIENMITQLKNRGPDFRKVSTDECVALGHSRLSIIDPGPASNQPMTDSTNTLTITFNGEIYNYVEIKHELISKGVKFRTSGDTEVILEAFRTWGTEAFKKLNGMFAFALWDKTERKLYLVRDRFGKKPLYYFHKNKRLIFASEVNALKTHELCPRNIDLTALRKFLSLNYTTTDGCILENVQKIAPSTWIEFNEAGISKAQSYWDYAAYFKNKIDATEENLLEEVNDLIVDAVRIRLRSDVPVCQFFSGGIDSSILAAFSTAMRSNLRGFTLKFDDTRFDESVFAEKIAKHLDLKNDYLALGNNIQKNFEDSIAYMDEPFADSSFIPTAMLSKLSSEEHKVAITGDGGDEIFAGYNTYIADALHLKLNSIPRLATKIAHSAFVSLYPPGFGKVGFDEKVRRFLYGLSENYQRAHFSWRIIFHNKELFKLLKPHLHYSIDTHDPFLEYQKYFSEVSELDPIDQALFVDARTWLVDDILYKSDRASMMNSQEIRSPLLDYRVAQRLAQVPVKNKFSIRNKKAILKKLLFNHVPAKIIQRQKKGFNSPLHSWLEGPLQTRLQEVINEPTIKSIFDEKYINRLVSEQKQRKRDNSLKLYGLLVLGSWIVAHNYNL